MNSVLTTPSATPTPSIAKRLTGAIRSFAGASMMAGTPRARSTATASRAAVPTTATASRGSTHGNRSPATPPAVEAGAGQPETITDAEDGLERGDVRGPFGDGVVSLEVFLENVDLVDDADRETLRAVQSEFDQISTAMEKTSESAIRKAAKLHPVDGAGRTLTGQLEFGEATRRDLKDQRRKLSAAIAPAVARALAHAAEILAENLADNETAERSRCAALGVDYFPSASITAMTGALQRLQSRIRIARNSPDYTPQPRQALRGLGLEF